MNVIALQRIALEFFIDAILYPIWWYTGGVIFAAKYCYGIVWSANDRLAPVLWIKNLLVPMFGQYDWQGRIISFFMRLTNFILREILVFFVAFFSIFLFLVWLALPLVVGYMTIISLR